MESCFSNWTEQYLHFEPGKHQIFEYKQYLHESGPADHVHLNGGIMVTTSHNQQSPWFLLLLFMLKCLSAIKLQRRIWKALLEGN